MDRIPTRVVILGGGFGGVYAAKALERLARKGAALDITLVSQENFFLFTPMLHEIAASDLNVTHIVSPLRTLLRRTRVFVGSVESIDLDTRRVLVSHGFDRHAHEIEYDHLIVALGSVTNFYHLPGLETNALTMRTLGDAIHLRNRVIATLEEADTECASAQRDGLLTVVVAGGGFAGVETLGAMNDFVREALVFYPRLRDRAIRMVLVHAGHEILPELGDELGSVRATKTDGARARSHHRCQGRRGRAGWCSSRGRAVHCVEARGVDRWDIAASAAGASPVPLRSRAHRGRPDTLGSRVARRVVARRLRGDSRWDIRAVLSTDGTACHSRSGDGRSECSRLDARSAATSLYVSHARATCCDRTTHRRRARLRPQVLGLPGLVVVANDLLGQVAADREEDSRRDRLDARPAVHQGFRAIPDGPRRDHLVARRTRRGADRCTARGDGRGTMRFAVLVGSVRSDRQGIRAARFVERSLAARGHEVTLVDPCVLNLPLLDRMYKEYPAGQAPHPWSGSQRCIVPLTALSSSVASTTIRFRRR